MNIYEAGAVVEVDFGKGTCLTHYNADMIAENLARCSAVHLISTEAYGARPVIEHGTAYNADGVLLVMRWAIERARERRSSSAC
jgi:hypothetical protein